MSIRGLIALLLLIGAVGGGWQQRERLQAWVGAASAARPAGTAGGELRKCVNGSQVTYANVECPAGTQAQAVTGGTVTVVPGAPVAKPAAASGPSALHKALDVTRDDTLRDKIMERQMDAAR